MFAVAGRPSVLKVSVGTESVFELGPRNTLAVMVKPGGPLHIFELGGHWRSRTIRYPNATKEGGMHDLASSCIAFDAAGKRVVVSGAIAGTAWFDLRTNTLLHQTDELGRDRFFGCYVGFTPSERYVFSADLQVFDVATGATVFEHHLGQQMATRRRAAASGNDEWRTAATLCAVRSCLVVNWKGNDAKTVVITLESGQLNDRQSW